jgi:hypothetical protein
MAEDQLLDELMARLTMADSADTAPDAPQQQQQGEEVRDTVGARKCMTEELSAYLREATACRSATEELMAALGKLVHGQVSLMTEGGGEAQMCAIGAADAAVRGVAGSVASRVDQLQRATHARMVTLGGDVACTEMRIRANLDASLHRRMAVCEAAYEEAVARFYEGMLDGGWTAPSQPDSCIWSWSSA